LEEKKTTGKDEAENQPSAEGSAEKAADESARSKNGGWQKIEELREKAELKESLADVWDEDFDLDEEILAELDHTAEFFTTQEAEPEDIPDDDEEIDEFYEDEDV
jgi:hypothetical protein